MACGKLKARFFCFCHTLAMFSLPELIDRSRDIARSKSVSPDRAAAMAIDELAEQSGSALEEAELHQSLVTELSGLGVLQPLMENPAIEEIWINKPGQVHYFDQAGHQTLDLDFDHSQLRTLVYRMLRHSGRRVDRVTPFVDASLLDGSRLHVVIPELTKEHWAINIRKFRKSLASLDDLHAAGVITPDQLSRLRVAMKEQKSILIAGATQAGKTTLMSALLNELGPDERLVSCEDTFELSISHGDWVAMQTRPASPEGAQEIGLRELVKQALRMRPSRLVIGEVRGAEALDMLVALNSGIPGLCTLHANSAKAAVRKLLTLPLLAGENITDAFLRPTVLGAFDYAVFCKRNPDGRRFVEEILEVSDAVLS
jgi:pilus assembly protein CpaF